MGKETAKYFPFYFGQLFSPQFMDVVTHVLHYYVKDFLIFISKPVWTYVKSNIIKPIRNVMPDFQSSTVCFLFSF